MNSIKVKKDKVDELSNNTYNIQIMNINRKNKNH